MPEITRFNGIIIKIQFRGEHNPPHIHASYGEFAGVFEIATMEQIEGNLPAKQAGQVQEWGLKYTAELQEMWDKKVVIKLPS